MVRVFGRVLGDFYAIDKVAMVAVVVYEVLSGGQCLEPIAVAILLRQAPLCPG